MALKRVLSQFPLKLGSAMDKAAIGMASSVRRSIVMEELGLWMSRLAPGATYGRAVISLVSPGQAVQKLQTSVKWRRFCIATSLITTFQSLIHL
jgi:hypothetical protein